MSPTDLIIGWLGFIAFMIGLPIVIKVGGWLADFLKREPKPDTREWGNRAESAAEDERIMRELSSLRAQANRDGGCQHE